MVRNAMGCQTCSHETADVNDDWAGHFDQLLENAARGGSEMETLDMECRGHCGDC